MSFYSGVTDGKRYITRLGGGGGGQKTVHPAILFRLKN